MRDVEDHEGKAEQESGSEGKGDEDQPSKTECELPQTSEELVNCAPRAAITKEVERDDSKETVSHQEKEARVEEKQPQGEGDNNHRGSEGEGEKTPIPPPRRKRKKKLKRNPSLENLEVVIMLMFHDLVVYLCNLDIHTMATLHGNVCQLADSSHSQTPYTCICPSLGDMFPCLLLSVESYWGCTYPPINDSG